ncbi:hypothetical protein AYI69_g10208 [Smittium culicis]|uniref:Uncharacterized protein n=3 Tax=Smittium culicis TaxID=133412 RepID=A0A1R1X7C2_9FUNG|nr:hypothetical protein AYI69_g10208 [Smittium culicis]
MNFIGRNSKERKNSVIMAETSTSAAGFVADPFNLLHMFLKSSHSFTHISLFPLFSARHFCKGSEKHNKQLPEKNQCPGYRCRSNCEADHGARPNGVQEDASAFRHQDPARKLAADKSVDARRNHIQRPGGAASPEQDHAWPGAQVPSSRRHRRVPERHETRRSRHSAAVRVESRQVLLENDRGCVLERPASAAPDGAQQLLARSGGLEDQRAAAARIESREGFVRYR